MTSPTRQRSKAIRDVLAVAAMLTTIVEHDRDVEPHRRVASSLGDSFARSLAAATGEELRR